MSRFFHGYYDSYCYQPLYVFSGNHLLSARLRPSNIDACDGTVDVLERLIPQIRSRFPDVRIIVRGDSGFAREYIMLWCEENGVDYVLGLAKNNRLRAKIAQELAQAETKYMETGCAARVFRDFQYSTLKSWSRKRRVIGKAEHLSKGANPRFVVTSLSSDDWEKTDLYEKLYCARGEMENRIKEQQMCLFADRTSTATMRANQIRLWFSSFAYTLLEAFRRLGLHDTKFARGRCDTIRLKLLKIGAVITLSMRRILVSIAESYPRQALFRLALSRLHQAVRVRNAIPMHC